MTELAVVVVTYKTDFLNTPSSKILLDYAKKNKIKLIIYDNKAVAPKISNRNVINIQTTENHGLAKPYNTALKYAIDNNAKWLMLLDHDTQITETYLKKVMSTNTEKIKAILPIIKSNDTIISPLSANNYISLRKKEVPKQGLTNDSIMAINSASVLSIDQLFKIGGFNEKFSLDFLDHWLFWEFNKIKSKKYIIVPEQIMHSLSVQNINSVSYSRYESILNSEILFYTEYNKDQLDNFVKNLLLRSFKQFIFVKNRTFWKLTLSSYLKLKKGKL
ncbi:glycosyltransferase [Companilactobacillus sp. DQM5]|uniref:glycosyltransferase n=1 Tax=Companilactobacillus sp. DQM5 TaxID=3463359 RepID=UPI00405872FA